MAKRSTSTNSITSNPFADTANLTDSQYMGAFTGGSSTQRTNILEIFIGGQAPSSSSPVYPVLARTSTVAATASGGSFNDNPLDAASAALAAPVVVGNGFTTKPQMLSTGHLLNLSFNAYGGIVRWVPAPGSEISMVTATQPLGGLACAMFTGSTASALVGSHIIYETL